MLFRVGFEVVPSIVLGTGVGGRLVVLVAGRVVVGGATDEGV